MEPSEQKVDFIELCTPWATEELLLHDLQGTRVLRSTSAMDCIQEAFAYYSASSGEEKYFRSGLHIPFDDMTAWPTIARREDLSSHT